MGKNYQSPPITEAVIDIQLKRKMPESAVKQVLNRVGKHYVRRESLEQGSFTINFVKRASTTEFEFEGEKLSSEDSANIVMVRKAGLLVSRLAPYEGWEAFYERFQQAWEIWKTRVPKDSDSCRLGVRYINRIDVPTDAVGKVRIEDFFTVHLNTPDPDMLLGEFLIRFGAPVPKTKFHQIVHIGTAAPALINHHSFILDVDVFSTQENATQKSLCNALGEIREIKNDLFEGYLTNQAKALFR